MGYVYILESSNSYKIGRTKNEIKKRLQTLQTGSSNPILLKTSIQSNREDILESRLHQIFAIYRYQGEWFKLNNMDKELLIHPYCNNGYCHFNDDGIIIQHSLWLEPLVTKIKENIEIRLFITKNYI